MEDLKKQYFKQFTNEDNSEEIEYLVANKNYTMLYFANGLVKNSGYNLLKFEDLFKKKRSFKRIHRKFIVNLNFVETIDIENQLLKIKNGPALQISRRKMKKLEKEFVLFLNQAS